MTRYKKVRWIEIACTGVASILIVYACCFKFDYNIPFEDNTLAIILMGISTLLTIVVSLDLVEFMYPEHHTVDIETAAFRPEKFWAEASDEEKLRMIHEAIERGVIVQEQAKILEQNPNGYVPIYMQYQPEFGILKMHSIAMAKGVPIMDLEKPLVFLPKIDAPMYLSGSLKNSDLSIEKPLNNA